MSNCSDNLRNRKSVRKAHAYARAEIWSRPLRKIQTELAWLECEERKARCALISAQVEDQKVTTSLAKRRASRGDAVLALTFLVLLLQMLLPKFQLETEIVIPLITLAGVALGFGRRPGMMRRQPGE